MPEHLRPRGLHAIPLGWAELELPLLVERRPTSITRMALWAGIGGPVPGFTTMSVWTPSFHANAKPCSRKAALWLVSSALSLISFTCSHASLIPCIQSAENEFCHQIPSISSTSDLTHTSYYLNMDQAENSRE